MTAKSRKNQKIAAFGSSYINFRRSCRRLRSFDPFSPPNPRTFPSTRRAVHEL